MDREKGNGGSRVGEVVGGTAAVCCCCPCVVMHLLIMAFKIPCGIFKRKKRKLQTRGLLRKMRTKKYSCSSSMSDHYPRPMKDFGIMLDTATAASGGIDDDESSESGFGGLDMEIWDQFYRGFWRSPSLNED